MSSLENDFLDYYDLNQSLNDKFDNNTKNNKTINNLFKDTKNTEYYQIKPNKKDLILNNTKLENKTDFDTHINALK